MGCLTVGCFNTDRCAPDGVHGKIKRYFLPVNFCRIISGKQRAVSWWSGSFFIESHRFQGFV